MRAIGLVLLSTALLLTDADAKRRSSARGSQAAGASRSWCATYPSQGLNDNCRDRWMGVRDLPISLKPQSLAALGHFPAWTTRHQAGFYYGRETFPNEGPKRLV